MKETIRAWVIDVAFIWNGFFFFFFFFGCFSGFLQIKVNLIRSNLPFFSFYSDLISLFWLKSKSAAWSSSTVAAKVDQSLLRLSLKSTPMMTTPCSLAKSNQNLRILTPTKRIGVVDGLVWWLNLLDLVGDGLGLLLDDRQKLG